ncbi:hypothetical protein HIM_03528 [Hirsutella minnesotensis 3608]|uniref:Uncharacterized protein n=1 Tax=Hirsutella minnesotensis 3608 TaxID=1043627 RepID=A0A0F8A2R7_9HYPO|nr:hypothetical protein HIM_03528 [Hirsutella minnesotensis 3608]
MRPTSTLGLVAAFTAATSATIFRFGTSKQQFRIDLGREYPEANLDFLAVDGRDICNAPKSRATLHDPKDPFKPLKWVDYCNFWHAVEGEPYILRGDCGKSFKGLDYVPSEKTDYADVYNFKEEKVGACVFEHADPVGCLNNEPRYAHIRQTTVKCNTEGMAD